MRFKEVRSRVSLRELTKRIPHKDSWPIYEPTGVLAIKIDGYGGVEWKDGKVPLEEHLVKVLNKFEIHVEELNAIWR